MRANRAELALFVWTGDNTSNCRACKRFSRPSASIAHKLAHPNVQMHQHPLQGRIGYAPCTPVDPHA